MILLGVIILIAAFFRIYRINDVPARLNHDEMSFTYNTYSILKTGRDEWNKPFPLIFTAFGDYKTPFNIYLSVPFVALWGMTHLSTKIVSILSGLAVVVLMYGLTKVLTKRTNLSLVAALLVAINPWPIQVSRVAINTHLALVFYMLGIILYLLARRKNSLKWAAFAGIAWGLTFYDYVAYRLLILIIALILLGWTLWKRRQELKLLLTAGISLLIVVLPFINNTFNTAGQARFKTTSIFFDEGIVMAINEKRAFCYLNDPTVLTSLCTLVFNKPLEYTLTLTKNWAEFLMPTFLFIEGDRILSHSMPGYGMFLLALLPFYLVGLYVWFKKSDDESNLVKLAFLVAPIPSALTGPPQTMRGTPLIPFVILFTATGIMTTYEWLKKRNHVTSDRSHVTKGISGPWYLAPNLWFALGLSLITAFFLFRYSLDYFFIFPSQHDDAQYMLDRRLADYVRNEEDNFDKIFINNQFPDAYIVLAYYNRIDPAWLANNLIRYPADKFGFMHAKQLGKYYFERPDVKGAVCNPDERVLIFTDVSETESPTQVFYNFSHVHPQVKVYDTVLMREQMMEKQEWEGYCGIE